MRKIRIYKNEEYQIRNDIKKEIRKDSYLYPVYARAADIVRDICVEIDAYERNSGKNNEDKRKGGYGRIDNILLITGNRGQGKTSALYTFAECLKRDTDEKRQLIDNEKQAVDFYLVHGVIDPSAMAKKESIVRVFLSGLYEEYSSHKVNIEKNCGEVDYSENQEILKLFQNCYQNLENIENRKWGGKYDQDEIDLLAELGDSGNLAVNIYDLIKSLLKFVGSGNEEKNYKFMVIRIDDADLAIGRAYRIIDEIRNYLSESNLIVLMAADSRQLEYAVKQEYVKKYNALIQIDNNQGSKEMVRHCFVQAGRFIEKIFPEGHCVSLPELGNDMKSRLNPVAYEYIDRMGEGVSCDNNVQESQSLIKQLLYLVYQKTGVILVSEETVPHAFFPRTLRELSHFVKLFHSMENVDTGLAFSQNAGERSGNADLAKRIDQERTKILDNLRKLEEYICRYWCVDRLNGAGTQRIRDFFEENNWKTTYFIETWRQDDTASLSERKSADDAISLSESCLFNRISAECWDHGEEIRGLGDVIRDKYSEKTENAIREEGEFYFRIEKEILKGIIEQIHNDDERKSLEKWTHIFSDEEYGQSESFIMFDVQAMFNKAFSGDKTQQAAIDNGFGVNDNSVNDNPGDIGSVLNGETVLIASIANECREILVNTEYYHKFKEELNRTEKEIVANRDRETKMDDEIKYYKQRIDDVVNRVKWWDSGNRIGEYFYNSLILEGWYMVLYLCNPGNMEKYKGSVKKELLLLMESIKAMQEQPWVKDGYSKDSATVSSVDYYSGMLKKPYYPEKEKDWIEKTLDIRSEAHKLLEEFYEKENAIRKRRIKEKLKHEAYNKFKETKAPEWDRILTAIEELVDGENKK